MLSKRKRCAFIAVTVVGVIVVVELVSLVAIHFVHRSFASMAQRRHKIADQDPMNPRFRSTLPVMIHPFQGAVLQPVRDESKNAKGLRITEFGFIDEASPIHRRSSDRVIVVILGGSVARQLATNACPILERELSKIPRYSGKRFQFVRIAIDGYKQPQQLMTINYLMSLGAEFDIVINLDGVNEAALPRMDNVPFGIAAAYPRKWSTLISAAGTLQISRTTGLIEYLRQRQQETAAAFDTIPWKYSPTCSLLWNVKNDRSERSIVKQIEIRSRMVANELSYCSSGPPEKFESDQQLYEYCTDIWFRSSVLLHAICQQHEAKYFHFLQPNQYVPNAKPFDEAESSIAINIASPFRIPIQQCFPIMQSKADSFRSAGVAFFDLTQVFANRSEALYIDDCCHVNSAGDEILAAEIAARIQRHLDSEP